MSEILYEYNPCVRKGKYIHSTQKKPKKYEPKAQKRNLDKTRCHKMVEPIEIIDDKDSLTELMEILSTQNVLKWNNNYDNLYKQYDLDEIEEFKQGYITIKQKFYQEYWNRIFKMY